MLVEDQPGEDVDHERDAEMETESEEEMTVCACLVTQCTLKAGLEKHGMEAEKVVIGELTQLHAMGTWTPQDPTKLSRAEKLKALSSLTFIKEKRDGKTKGRACVNGAPQRGWMPKEDATSPTVATESTFITSATAASESRHV